MNYYIEGNPDKAEQIKAAFESKGYETTGWKFNDERGIYYTAERRIDLACGKFLINLIKTHPDYKRLVLPIEPKFKVGDWVATDYGKVSQVVSVDNDGDGYTLDDGVYFSCSWCDMYHHWTIQDAKDGDVLVYQGEIFLFNLVDNNSVLYYCCFDGELVVHSFYAFSNEDLLHVHPAHKEQRDLLFAKMKEAGYEWDADKKELRKIQPHYNIANFKPKQWVLVRDDDEWEWALTRFSYLSNGSASLFVCINGASFQQCIPYEGNEHLLGTTDMPSEEYINW